jgi:hypothetical protein
MFSIATPACGCVAGARHANPRPHIEDETLRTQLRYWSALERLWGNQPSQMDKGQVEPCLGAIHGLMADKTSSYPIGMESIPPGWFDGALAQVPKLCR